MYAVKPAHYPDPAPEYVADVIEEWADTLERLEWIQGTLYLYEDDGPRTQDRDIVGACMVGGLEYNRERATLAAPTASWGTLHEAYGRARNYVAAHLGVHGSTVDALPEWNDDPNRTKQEVLDALRATAKEVRRLADEDPGLR